MAAKKAAEAQPDQAGANFIKVPAFNFRTLVVTVRGATPLICHAFSQKLLREMAEKRSTDEEASTTAGSKKKRAPRKARDFQAEYESSLYPIDGKPGRYGFPAIGFKRGIVGATRQIDGLDMTLANRIIFVNAPYRSRGQGVVMIEGDKPKMREDMVRLQDIARNPDVRYRAEFTNWSATLEIEYNASMITEAGILLLLRYAGKSEGIGEQRPSARKAPGDFGQYDIDPKHLAEGA